jgi:GT2 family glycosyltransferase
MPAPDHISEPCDSIIKFRPLISIIILNLNEASLTLDCIGSIVKNTAEGLYEIIVVDNGSSALEAERLANTPSRNFRLIALSRNMFFGEANNIGAEHARGKFVLFLNNDVQVTANWLEPLLAVFDNEPCVGAVGPKILYPDGRLQEAGAYVREDGWTLQIGKRGLVPHPSYSDAIQVVDYCSAACLLVMKDIFLSLGGFDPLFHPAYFEDADLALRLRSLGLFSYYCGLAVVYHQENVTSRRIWSEEEFRGHLDANRGRFVERWGDYLRMRLSEDCEPEQLPPVTWESEPETRGNKDIVLYSPTPLGMSPISRRLLRFASAFQDFFNITIASDDISSRCKIYSLSRHFGVTLKSFKVRRFSELDPPGGIVVLFGDKETEKLVRQHEFLSEHDDHALLQLIDKA